MLHAFVAFKFLLKKLELSSVQERDITTGLLAGQLGSWASILSSGWQRRDLSLLQKVLTVPRTHPVSYLIGRGGLSPGIKRPKREVDQHCHPVP